LPLLKEYEYFFLTFKEHHLKSQVTWKRLHFVVMLLRGCLQVSFATVLNAWKWDPFTGLSMELMVVLLSWHMLLVICSMVLSAQYEKGRIGLMNGSKISNGYDTQTGCSNAQALESAHQYSLSC